MSKVDATGQPPKTTAPKKADAAAGLDPDDCPPGTVKPPSKADAVETPTQAPSDIKPTETMAGSLPPGQVNSISYSEPDYVAPAERTIEVAGAGMGSYKKYTMLESEALAVYTLIRDNKGSISPELLKQKLKERYGIDADITRVDGKIALVNKATGNAIAVDTEGNGALGFEDLQFKDALLAAGIDPDRKRPHFNPFDLAMKVITEANETSKKRREEEEAFALERSEALREGAPTPGSPAVGSTPGATAVPSAPPSSQKSTSGY